MVAGLAVVMVLVSMLPIVERLHFSRILGLGLRLVASHNNEAFLLQLADLLTTELTGLGLVIRATAFLLHLRLPFTVFGLVLTSLTRLLVLPTTVVSSGSALSPSVTTSVISVSSSALSVTTISLLGSFFSLGLSRDWFSRLFGLFYRGRLSLDFHIGNRHRCGFLHLFNFLLTLHLRDRLDLGLDDCYRLSDLDGLRFDFGRDFYPFLFGNSLLNLLIAVCFNIGSKGFLELFVISERFEGVRE